MKSGASVGVAARSFVCGARSMAEVENMAEVETLTKGQRRRRNERWKREQQDWWDKTMGPMPDHLIGWPDGERNIPQNPPTEAWERAPSHMVEHDECPSLDAGALRQLSQASASARGNERAIRIAELKARYPDIWGKRGAAKVIASLETEGGSPLDERTVRKYFRDG